MVVLYKIETKTYKDNKVLPNILQTHTNFDTMKGEHGMNASAMVDLKELWEALNAETMGDALQHDAWDDDYDDYVCCVGGYSD